MIGIQKTPNAINTKFFMKWKCEWKYSKGIENVINIIYRPKITE